MSCTIKILILNWLRTRKFSQFFKAGKIYASSGNMLTDSWSWQSFVSSYDLFDCLFPRLYKMKHSCYQYSFVIHRWFVYWVFGWEMRHNVSTNIGHRFLTLVDKHFPKDYKLRKIFNRNTIKISYSCMNNTKQIIDNHNKCTLNPPVHTDKTANNATGNKKGNCRQKKTHAHLTETASNHQLSTKPSSNVRTITLLKRTSDSQKRLQDKIQKSHTASFRQEKHRNSTELISGLLKTRTLTTLFHGISFHHAQPTIPQVKDAISALKRNFS